MRLLEKGYINIILEFEKLKKNWDGYNAKPIKKKVLDRFRDMKNLSEWIKMFRSVGFDECDIEVAPTPNGTIQLEAEKNNIYLEIEIK